MAQQPKSAGDSATPGSAAQTGTSSLDQAHNVRAAEASSIPTSEAPGLADWRLSYAREAISDIYTFAAVSLQPHDPGQVGDELLQAACLARIVQLAEVAMSALGDETETRAKLHRKLTGLPLRAMEGAGHA